MDEESQPVDHWPQAKEVNLDEALPQESQHEHHFQQENVWFDILDEDYPLFESAGHNFQDFDLMPEDELDELEFKSPPPVIDEEAHDWQLEEGSLQEAPWEQPDAQENLMFFEAEVLDKNPCIEPFGFPIDGFDFIHEDDPVRPVQMVLVESDDDYKEPDKFLQFQVPQPETMDFQPISEVPLASNPFGSEIPGVLHIGRDGQIIDRPMKHFSALVYQDQGPEGFDTPVHQDQTPLSIVNAPDAKVMSPSIPLARQHHQRLLKPSLSRVSRQRAPISKSKIKVFNKDDLPKPRPGSKTSSASSKVSNGRSRLSSTSNGASSVGVQVEGPAQQVTIAPTAQSAPIHKTCSGSSFIKTPIIVGMILLGLSVPAGFAFYFFKVKMAHILIFN